MPRHPRAIAIHALLLLPLLSPALGAVPADTTRVVILGTGTPNADPDRWGPAVAVVVDGRSYLVDAGPGVVRRAAAAARKHGLGALEPDGLRRVFLTHLHSDHTLGLPDLMMSPWVLERQVPLSVFGPEGTSAMTSHIEEAWREDIGNRLYGLEPQRTRNYRALVHEIGPGIVYEDPVVTVEAFRVTHGTWPDAFGYRFETPDGVVVVSGDTVPSEAVVEACNGCDILVHEVYSAEAFRKRSPEWQAYHAASHTSTIELADIARRARPALLVLYHQLYWGATDDDLVREIREAGYDGPVVSASDLDEFPTR